MLKKLARTPPVAVRRLLRQQSQFTCAFPGCFNPYLEYHHFDPPWHESHHHFPAGMIALCATHHGQADAGNFTIEQMQDFKALAKSRNDVRGRFNYLRRNVAISAGGGIYYNCESILTVNDKKVIWLTRNANGYYLLNIDTPDVKILNNDWITDVNQLDIDSPPNGKKLHIHTKNNEHIEIDYYEVFKAEQFSRFYDPEILGYYDIKLPLTIVSFAFFSKSIVDLASFEIKRDKIIFPGNNTISGAVIISTGGSAFAYNGPLPEMWLEDLNIRRPVPENLILYPNGLP